MTEVALQAVELVRRIEGDSCAHPRQRHRPCGEEGRIPRHYRAVGIGQIVAALSAGPARCSQRRRGHHLRSADLEIIGIGTGRCPPDQMRLRVPVPFPAAGVHLARQCAAADACSGQDDGSRDARARPFPARLAWTCRARQQASQPALRRPAPARRHRPRAFQPPRDHRGRRADGRARYRIDANRCFRSSATSQTRARPWSW